MHDGKADHAILLALARHDVCARLRSSAAVAGSRCNKPTRLQGNIPMMACRTKPYQAALAFLAVNWQHEDLPVCRRGSCLQAFVRFCGNATCREPVATPTPWTSTPHGLGIFMHLDCRRHRRLAAQPMGERHDPLLHFCDLDLERRHVQNLDTNAPLPFDELAEAIKGRRSVYVLISGLRLDRAAPARLGRACVPSGLRRRHGGPACSRRGVTAMLDRELRHGRAARARW